MHVPLVRWWDPSALEAAPMQCGEDPSTFTAATALATTTVATAGGFRALYVRNMSGGMGEMCERGKPENLTSKWSDQDVGTALALTGSAVSG